MQYTPSVYTLAAQVCAALVSDSEAAKNQNSTSSNSLHLHFVCECLMTSKQYKYINESLYCMDASDFCPREGLPHKGVLRTPPSLRAVVCMTSFEAIDAIQQCYLGT